jgi:iron complex transport system ATP-binding protein
MNPEPVLELRRATLMKGDRRVLDDVTLTVYAGEHLAIVGPNGSGKSSLIHLLTRQHYPLHRADGPPPVRLFGREEWDVVELRSRLGIVSPDLHQRFVSGTDTGHLRALDVVVSGFFASEVLYLHHRVTSDLRRQARHALERVASGHLAQRPVNAMSTGEARRVLIARALVNGARVLVLDEPTTGLDLVARNTFLADLRRIAADGTTLLLITHRVEEILPEIERVLLLREGRVAYDGPKDAVLTSTRLAEVFGHPVQLQEREGEYRLTIAFAPPEAVAAAHRSE